VGTAAAAPRTPLPHAVPPTRGCGWGAAAWLAPVEGPPFPGNKKKVANPNGGSAAVNTRLYGSPPWAAGGRHGDGIRVNGKGGGKGGARQKSSTSWLYAREPTALRNAQLNTQLNARVISPSTSKHNTRPL
jgi:hypothetical protein